MPKLIQLTLSKTCPSPTRDSLLRTDLDDAGQVVHLELGLGDSGSHLPDVLGQVQSCHLLEDRVPLSLGEVLDLPHKGRVLLQRRVELVKVGLLGPVGDVDVVFPELALPGPALAQLGQELIE